jgi:hypothetical protein
LHILDPEEYLIVKLNSSLLMVFRREVDLFDSASLDKAFLWALAMECKVDPRIHSPQTQSGPFNVGPSIVHPSTYPTSPASPSTPNNAP